MNTRPQLCLGHVMHRRLRPAVNAFVYPVFYVQLPVRDLAAAEKAFPAEAQPRCPAGQFRTEAAL